MMIDNRVLAARHYAPDLSRTAVYDTVSVRDMVIDARIGIHEPELATTQRVRISAEVGVLPPSALPDENIDNVISYDYLIEGIRAVTGNEHIKLAETMAERIADWCLADRRAVYARVKVEKLDRLPSGVLVVEILRQRRFDGGANVYDMMARDRQRPR